MNDQFYSFIYETDGVGLVFFLMGFTAVLWMILIRFMDKKDQ